MKYHDIIKKPARKITKAEKHRKNGMLLANELRENLDHAKFIDVKYL